MGRKPRGYRGVERTHRMLGEIAPLFLEKVQVLHEERPDLVIQGWSQIVGEGLAPMARAVSFSEGVLLVKVANSSLYQLLAQHEKKRLLQVLRETFPGAEIRNIVFRLG